MVRAQEEKIKQGRGIRYDKEEVGIFNKGPGRFTHFSLRR